ncbi:MAG TPA: hypothetical protein VIA29_10385 [Thermoanaerobaculia bacterium]|jgi:hypothetical protein
MADWSRRELLGTGAAALIASSLPGATPGEASRPAPRPGADALDAALEILAPSGPEFHGGLANHGPMAAEALVALDRPEIVVPWVESYRRRLDEKPRGSRPIVAGEWREALGDGGRIGDWIAFFEREVEARGWRGALSEWSERLAPGIAAAAFHGAIRTAHAVRSLEEKEDAARRRELANGLAYWAARYDPIAEAAAGSRPVGPPSKAIASVPILPPERRTHGFITERLAPLDEVPTFPAVAGLADASGDASAFLSDLTATFAGLYLDHAGPGSTIAMIHAVTGPSAVRLILPHATEPGRRRLLRYSWQSAAAIYASNALATPNPRRDAATPNRAELIEAAVATRDEHGFKFVEACLREHAIEPNPVYLAAARDAARRLG